MLQDQFWSCLSLYGNLLFENIQEIIPEYQEEIHIFVVIPNIAVFMQNMMSTER
jgi:hypothetical protein